MSKTELTVELPVCKQLKSFAFASDRGQRSFILQELSAMRKN